MKKIFTLLLGIYLAMTVSCSCAQWSTNPAVNNIICNLAGEQAIPKIATCTNGDSYIGYFSSESGNYNVRLQRLDALGNILWTAGGILISAHSQETWLTDWDMTCDAANHAILAFNDIRAGGTNVVVYRISPTGSFVWGPDGIMLSNSTAFNAAPKVIATNSGNIVVAWSADEDIIMQKLNPAGTLQWGPAGITLSSANTLSWPQLMPVGTDDFIMKYFDDSGPAYSPTRHVFAQRYGPSGTAVWSSPATISNAGGISAWTQIFPFVNDGSDGFYITWHDDRDNNQRASVFVHHISNTGSPLWTANGVEVSNLASMNHYYPQLAFPSGSTDVYVFWNEMNALQSQWGIFGQKIGSTGNLQWGSGGMTFIPVSSTNVLPYEARRSPTDIVLFYEESVSAVTGMIKAMRISPAGSFVWTPVQKDISTVASSKVHPVINEFANNQWILAWEDDRSGQSDIYAQNIQLDGTLGPVNSGTISGMITLNGGPGNVTQVLVKAGSYTTYPDPSGFYSMSVPIATYMVTASLAGYQTASQANVVVSNNQTTTVNLTLNPEPVGYIQGTVTLNGGSGFINQVTVKAGAYTTNPDLTGAYTLIVAPGTYNVIATLTGYFPDTVLSVAVANQQTVAGINLTLNVAPTNGLITGTVTLNGGTGNVTQAVVSAGGGVATTSPNAAGFYTLDLPAGNYDVTASLSGYAPQTQTGVSVVVSQTTPNVNFTLQPLSASGHIQGTVTITGEPADVTQTTVTAGAWYVNPDATGAYDLVVPPGTYNVVATHPYTNSVTQTGIAVSNGQVTSGVNFILTVERADLIVKAIETQSGIMNGVNVYIEGPGGPYSGEIINDSLVFPRVPYGYYSGQAVNGMFIAISDTNVHASNHHLIFYFTITGMDDPREQAGIELFPNPVSLTGSLKIRTDKPGLYDATLTDLAGRRVSVQTLDLSTGEVEVSVKTLVSDRQLNPGLFVLEIKGSNNYFVNRKLVVGQ